MPQIFSAGTEPALKRFGWPAELLKGLLFFLLLLALLEAGLRLTGKAYSKARPSEFGPVEAAATVLCVGDSYTYGGNVSWRDAYPYQLWLSLKNTPGLRVVNRGHCEYNSSQVLDELRGNLEEFRPAVVLLLVGSSDRWNMLGGETSDAGLIRRKDYDGEMESLSAGKDSASSSLRVYKIYRSIKENLRFRYLLRTAKRLRSEKLAADYAAGRIKDRELGLYMDAMYYGNRYDELFELALFSLKTVPPGSDFFSRDLSIYFLLSYSFRYQAKYSAAQTAAILEELLSARPEFSGSEPFMKYLHYFQRYSLLEPLLDARLADNLEKAAAAVSASGARLIVMNYPGEHSQANRLLEKLAKDHGAGFIDVHAEFKKLIRTEGREKYLIGDDHATPEGYERMARLVLPRLKEALK